MFYVRNFSITNNNIKLCYQRKVKELAAEYRARSTQCYNFLPSESPFKWDLFSINCKGFPSFYEQQNKSLKVFAVIVSQSSLHEAVRTKPDLKHG